MSRESWALFPWDFRMLMALMGYLARLGRPAGALEESASAEGAASLGSTLARSTASTAISAKKSIRWPPMILELSEVLAALMRHWRPSASTGWESERRMYRVASRQAVRYPAMTQVGWTLFLISSLARFNNSPATMTTDVVPSPTSSSWSVARLTRTLAAGCSTSKSERIVAPSLVMVTPPT